MAWWMYKNCHCGGSLKEKFKHPQKPGLEVHIRPNRGIWIVMLNKRQADNGVAANLKSKLDTL